jgi:cephalosporin-C deacetylase-like acetyl esterase
MTRRRHWMMAAATVLSVPAWGDPPAPAGLKDVWLADGGRMTFAGEDLEIEAVLPTGFRSLRVRGHEFLHADDTRGGIVLRRPDGSLVTAFTSLDTTAHDATQGRKGTVADGLYLLSFITGWSLPRFELYVGFNDTADHEVVWFFGDGVRALRASAPGAPLAPERRLVTRDDRPGTRIAAKEIAVVHESGMVLRIGRAEGDVCGALVEVPGGGSRLALSASCKGMAANTFACAIDVSHAADALTLFPRFDVAGPTMGEGDPGYKPQSHGHWALYARDAKVDYSVSFGWLGAKPFDGKAIVTARHALRRGAPLTFEATPEKTDEDDGASLYRAVVRPRFTDPGVHEVHVYLAAAGGAVTMTERLRVLYDWPAYKPVYHAPDDLDAFWDETLRAARQTPLEPKIEATLYQDDPAWTFQHISFNGWQGRRVHACLYAPKGAAGPLPVAITAHPGTTGFGAPHRPDGVYGSRVKADPRFVTIVPLIRGHAPDVADIPFNQPWWGPLDTRDDYAARAWFVAMVRALDYLATRPELADMSRIVARGGSQGGALALATAALDPRVSLCIADSPSNCMHHDALTPGFYSTFGPSAGQVPPGQTLEDLKRTLSYYDPAHLAPRIRCPTIVHLTVGDLTVHAMGGLGVYKNLTGLPDNKKGFYPGVNGHHHAGSREGGRVAAEWTDALLRGEAPRRQEEAARHE